MNGIALKMLFGDRGKYLAIVFGLTCAALLVTQESGIFLGYMCRTYSFIDDTRCADVWVTNPELQFTEDAKRMPDTALLRVRGISGVQWAEPMIKTQLNVRMTNGHEQACSIIGVDDATLTGGPPQMIQGRVEDLRSPDSVIVDVTEATTRFAQTQADGTVIPLKVGDTLEVNDHRVKVVGFCRITKPFFWQPVIYSTYSEAMLISPQQRRMLSFVLVKARPGVELHDLCNRIRESTGQAAYTANEFRKLTAEYVVKQTGIAINFGIVVLLGLFIGTVIAGQTFYTFTLDNLRYFGMLKAMGASDRSLLKMVLLQAVVSGALGYGLGVGGAGLFQKVIQGSGLSMFLPWQLLVFSAGCLVLACVVPALLSARKVRRLEPAVVFKG
ncbi:MAG TPA: ABC transporter permease [Tepidisphaeraceae bacterium]|nr:ABC transporter permease [Tepidisphaeraceae bacterium]